MLKGQTTTQAEQAVQSAVATTSIHRSLDWVLSVERGMRGEYRLGASLAREHAKMEVPLHGRCSMARKLPIMLCLALSLGLVASACANEQPAIQSESGGGGEHED